MTMLRCELANHKDTNRPPALGFFQVYDPATGAATMTRPGALCRECVEFVAQCGLHVERVEVRAP